jgi:predicted dehydrogenase
MQSVATDRGPMLFATRVAGTGGTVWADGDRVRVADAAGVRELEIRPDLAVAAPDAPPADLMHSAYDLLHSTGIDFGPYTRLHETFKALIAGDSVTGDPPPPTFAEGVAAMRVLDAIRVSAREQRTVEVPSA